MKMIAPVGNLIQPLNLGNSLSDQGKASVDQVAQAFETLFLQTMLKAMRNTGLGDSPLAGGGEGDIYREMLDAQWAKAIAEGKGMGLAPLIARQLEGMQVQPSTGVRSKVDMDGTPESFTQNVWVHAVEAGRQLNVGPKTLIAQAALETGWGRHVLGSAEGSSNNLFNVKAGANWKGPTVEISSGEYIDGDYRQEPSSFRVYRSLDEAFADYVSLIKDSPRYQGAVAPERSDLDYLEYIHRAGYATDPDYVAKIDRIRTGPVLAQSILSLKNYS